LARDDEQRHDAAVFHRNFGADARAQIIRRGRSIKSWCAVHAIAVQQRRARQAQRERRFREILRIGSAAEKTERAAGVKFEVVHRLAGG